MFHLRTITLDLRIKIQGFNFNYLGQQIGLVVRCNRANNCDNTRILGKTHEMNA